MILGIDIGNCMVKTSKGTSFESRVTTIGNILSNDMTLELNGRKLFLSEGEYDTEYRKVKKQSYLDLFFGALALSTNEIENKVVLGLPLSQYKEDKENLKDLIMNNRFQELILNGSKKTLAVTDVEVFPEGVGATPKGFEGIVVDIGGRTTDAALIVNKGGKKKVESPISIPCGTLNLDSDFIKIINNTYGLDLKQKDTRRILKKGLSIYGEQQDISIALEVFKKFVEELISDMQLEYSIKTHDVALVGGGAELLYNPIRKRLPNCFLTPNAFWGNAKAYGEVGEQLWI